MKYNNVKEAVFIKRPNRFLAHIEIEDKEEICHVKNTGRLGELLLSGAKVYVSQTDNPKRKTKYSLIAVEKEGILYNIDSQAPNQLALEWIKEGRFRKDITVVKPEKTYKNSRFDLYMETEDKKIFMEVKGVTLNQNGIGMFPDAPTERGKKHVLELCDAVEEGYEAYILFVVKFKPVHGFSPNTERHPDFIESLQYAREKGVHIMAVCCQTAPDHICIDKTIPVFL
ncbi:MAG: DNA/RNA nuclease SfsA [Lachnospiraceae bacterium]|nr:DNA/RNA nuclease SfsA [Lachnospiraceae bacterium]